MDAIDLGDPKDGDLIVTAPQKPDYYYVGLLGTPLEPDGSPHIIAQSGEFHVMSCLPGEQGCAPAGTDTRWFYDTDAIGSVRLITDDGGATFARYDYAPFGEPTLAENPDNQRRFAGKELDAESGLNYFGARYFAAELGRFTAADPGQADGDPLHPQSWNAYAYSRATTRCASSIHSGRVRWMTPGTSWRTTRAPRPYTAVRVCVTTMP